MVLAKFILLVRFAICLCVLGCLTLMPWASARKARPRPVAELLVNATTGTILAAHLPDVSRRPASLAKIMALYLVFDAIDAGRLHLDDKVRISRRAERQPPSTMGLPEGRSLTVRAAIQAIAVHSANDVTVAIAEKIAGSERAFATAMTAKARKLGMSSTRFHNATGLTDPANTTTARDMATLARALLRNHPRDYAVFATRSIRWRSLPMINHNHMLGKVQGVDGIKTGYTADAGYNIVSSAKRRGRRVIAVVLGAESVHARDARAAKLVDFSFARKR
ncbi:D-alanyl-D-alanine carboxypeptidase family protein [Sphingomonas immobilis]|uniref:D-alanyl-D-alanine carboxypeptidase family protein n=1 Tax=Sphingomonas immobilis TaxID=3063997 RepID=A0ABT8ZXR7_9SPHN|nr:D-alanyl-D-alanine carboxypeptidase family protein [Sphingomonas sp. CA1-15]MDO7841805.1 D-alanyl-D-alanine carboxypeptidase family protein [Sphingomonas sp. CA1-15]